MNINGIIQKAEEIVARHRISEGVYSRYLWQNQKGTRKLGVNEYGCADATNILYTIGRFESCPEKRKHWVQALQQMQNPETGLFTEATHHPIHTTAHCIAALELFDARPLYPLAALMPYLDFANLHQMLEKLNWDYNPWTSSHQGAGLYAAMAITETCDAAWEEDYFSWLKEHADPVTGLGLKNRRGDAPLCHQLYGWFHYMFNHEYAHRPIPHPEQLIDSCLAMYDQHQLQDVFGKAIGFREIDWVFALNRASRLTPYRFAEIKERLRDFASSYLPWLDSLDPMTDDGLNDLHQLFGAMCAVAELQIALPGEIKSDKPLKNVLDRRPFI